ncbi:MAG: hypothetical protein JRJ49_00465 [Deltaproteobacteria bacterium]|nr:hypothetical protein [Deltaproteobacteria bacterium]
MKVSKNNLYILVEGEPNSPELVFFESAIKNIIDKNSFEVNFNLFDTGSASSFNIFARRIYLHSKLHQKIPIIAISDRDYRPFKTIEKRRTTTKLLSKIKNLIYYIGAGMNGKIICL